MRAALLFAPPADASAIGITVLQVTEIPPRPKTYDGAIGLFPPLKEGLDEMALRNAFESFGPLNRCAVGGWPPACAYFETHEEALAAKAAGPPAGVCGGINTLWKDHPYEGRGWCSLEESVSNEVMKRLQVHISPVSYTHLTLPTILLV